MLTRLRSAFGFTRHSSYLMSAFVLICLLIAYIWWPLVEEYVAILKSYSGLPWYRYVDWLLLGIFAFMSLTIMARANLRTDSLIVLVGLCGGLVIESWGTQTNLWHYYTAERPPLWIIPAWPIASLSIDRLTRAMRWATRRIGDGAFRVAFRLVMAAFLALMAWYVAPTFDKSFTWAALGLCLLLAAAPGDARRALLSFVAGSALGYFLEVWGTTRGCWIYYTNETPPVFAIFAHGMAAFAFWRTLNILTMLWRAWRSAPGRSVTNGG
jgi:hypothetical protein